MRDRLLGTLPAPVREPAPAPAPQAQPAVAPPAPQPTPVARPQVRTARDLTDLLQANARSANAFPNRGFNSLARAGVAVVTCMDSGIDPLGMPGLKPAPTR